MTLLLICYKIQHVIIVITFDNKIKKKYIAGETNANRDRSTQKEKEAGISGVSSVIFLIQNGVFIHTQHCIL